MKNVMIVSLPPNVSSTCMHVIVNKGKVRAKSNNSKNATVLI